MSGAQMCLTFEVLQMSLRRATANDSLMLGKHVGFCADVVPGVCYASLHYFNVPALFVAHLKMTGPVSTTTTSGAQFTTEPLLKDGAWPKLLAAYVGLCVATRGWGW